MNDNSWECPNCKHLNGLRNRYCQSCNTEISREITEAIFLDQLNQTAEKVYEYRKNLFNSFAKKQRIATKCIVIFLAVITVLSLSYSVNKKAGNEAFLQNATSLGSTTSDKISYSFDSYLKLSSAKKLHSDSNADRIAQTFDVEKNKSENPSAKRRGKLLKLLSGGYIKNGE